MANRRSPFAVQSTECQAWSCTSEVNKEREPAIVVEGNLRQALQIVHATIATDQSTPTEARAVACLSLRCRTPVGAAVIGGDID